MMRVFELLTYGDATDAFDPIRKFTDALNENMIRSLTLGSILTVDESMKKKKSFTRRTSKGQRVLSGYATL